MDEVLAELARIKGESQASAQAMARRVEELAGMSEQLRAEVRSAVASLRTTEQPVSAQAGRITAEQLAEVRSGARQKIEVRALVTQSDVSVLEGPTKRPGVVEQALLPVGFVDIVPAIPSGAEYEFIRETALSGNAILHTTADGAIDELDTTAVLASVQGIPIGANARFALAGGGFVERQITDVDAGTLTVTVDTAFGADIADGADVTIDAAGLVAEGETKPESLVEFEAPSVDLVMVPVTFRVTEQALASAPTLENFLRTRAAQSLRRSLNFGLIYGDGTTTIQGIMGVAGVHTRAWSDGEIGDNMADAVLRAAAQIPSDAQKYALLNVFDWLRILLGKNANDDYVHTPGRALVWIDAAGQAWIGDVKVIRDGQVREGDFAIWTEGASERPYKDMGALVFGHVNDQFIRNERTGRYEEFTQHCVLNPLLICVGEFDAPPAEAEGEAP